MTNTPIAAVVVTYRCERFIGACLDALLASTVPVDVVVVDNGSPDGTVAAIRRGHGGVKVIEQENLGYAGGVNRGLAHLSGKGYRHAFIVNPDAVAAPDCAERLSEFLDAHDDVAVVSPKVHYPDGVMIWYAGSSIDWAEGTTRNRGMGEPDRGQYDAAAPTDRACGAAMMVRLAAVDRVGPMPEDYFLYFEETDWSRRFATAGYGVHYVPSAVCRHDEGSSTGRGSSLFWYYMTRNNLLFMHRFRRDGWLRFRWALAKRSAHVMWLCLLKMDAPSLACVGAIVRGHVDFSLRRFGQRW